MELVKLRSFSYRHVIEVYICTVSYERERKKEKGKLEKAKDIGK